MELKNLIIGRRDRAKAVEILVKDLKVFAAFNEDLFKEITQLLTLENFRYEKCDFENCFCIFQVLAFVMIMTTDHIFLSKLKFSWVSLFFFFFNN